MVALEAVMEILTLIEGDNSVPKNVRAKIKDAMVSLNDQNGQSSHLKIDQVLQQLDDLSDDPNLPPYTRTQIWNVLSVLESK
jgi:uncharacterized protein (UPF0147 family)